MRFHKTDTQTLGSVYRIDQELALATDTGVGITCKSYIILHFISFWSQRTCNVNLRFIPDAIFH